MHNKSPVGVALVYFWTLYFGLYGRKKWKLTPVFLPGKSHGQRSLAGYSPWGDKSQKQLSN